MKITVKALKEIIIEATKTASDDMSIDEFVERLIAMGFVKDSPSSYVNVDMDMSVFIVRGTTGTRIEITDANGHAIRTAAGSWASSRIDGEKSIKDVYDQIMKQTGGGALVQTDSVLLYVRDNLYVDNRTSVNLVTTVDGRALFTGDIIVIPSIPKDDVVWVEVNGELEQIEKRLIKRKTFRPTTIDDDTRFGPKTATIIVSTKVYAASAEMYGETPASDVHEELEKYVRSFDGVSNVSAFVGQPDDEHSMWFFDSNAYSVMFTIDRTFNLKEFWSGFERLPALGDNLRIMTLP